MSFHLKIQNKTEWLLQQNHRMDGMVEAPNERMDTVYQGCCLKGFLESNDLQF